MSKSAQTQAAAPHFRQGDVLLERVNSLPQGVTPVAREGGRIVLAHGEVTGHAHAIKNRVAKFYQAGNGERFLEVPQACSVTHEEHGAIPLEPGIYRVKRQREYSPEAIRNVAD